MAATTATLKVYPFPQGIDNTQRRINISGQLTIGASPLTYTTGGIPLSWVTMTNQLTGEAIVLGTSGTAPVMAYFTSIAGSGYFYAYNKANNKLQILTTGSATQSPAAELTNASAIPAAVSGDVIEFDADFLKSI